MPKKSKERANRGRGRGNNGQDHQQPRPERSENGAAARVWDREEKGNLDEEKSGGTLEETAGPSQRTSSSRNQQSADTALSTEVKSKEKNPIPSPRSQDERPGPSGISLRPQTAPLVKPAWNTEKCEQTRKSCVTSPTSEESGASSNGNVCPPKRSGFDTVCLYYYDVEITPNNYPKAVNRDVVNAIVCNHKDTFKGHEPGFDGEKILISFIKLPTLVKIQFAASVNFADLKDFLSGKQNGKTAQDTVQALDIVLRQMPSNHFTTTECVFFPTDGRSTHIGEGLEVKFGFYQSVPSSQWKVMLVNIDVSGKGFYESEPVTEFLCETLGLRDLDDRKIQIDRERLKKAIRGVRIETTHMTTMRKKCTVWGVSIKSAEKLKFEMKDEESESSIKTTLARYFSDRYGLELRYPHLPCLQVGQKRDCYLPMEVCTIIPCQRRHLSEQQTANMIQNTARPAPARQTDIQPWLGPQDKALTPRDGSIMRNQALDMWALVCFHGCNEDPLRNFCHQLSSVSDREGIKMTAQPAIIAFGRGPEEVERLFFDCLDRFPALQLIMVVLPVFDKILHSEVKCVGDSLIGIPTQCVRMERVLQPKPEVCTSILLEINAKLGGTNHVIDDSVKPVFNEPIIVFGAHVTHPSSKESGFPSIAAVVASMDYHASKYLARPRVQNHKNGGGVQEIISDLVEIVKELLVEFYKTNRCLKPCKILFYRDGVSEGQFDQVLVHEVRAVQEACMKLEEEYRPRITFVVVQKGHRTRLFRENDRDASGKSCNVPPGTTVDSGIAYPYEFDFCLCSHNRIQGTSRQTHYHVLYDDNNSTADSLRQLTYQLCHVYARYTRRVSIPAPAYYAHLAASRARVHATNGNSSGSVDLEECARAIQVNDKMKGSMYFL